MLRASKASDSAQATCSDSHHGTGDNDYSRGSHHGTGDNDYSRGSHHGTGDNADSSRHIYSRATRGEKPPCAGLRCGQSGR